MSISKVELAKVAKLSRIVINDEDEEDIRSVLSQVFDWIDQLQEVDTTGVKPMSGLDDIVNLHTREDEVVVNNTAEDVLINAPNREMDFYVVPKVIDNS